MISQVPLSPAISAGSASGVPVLAKDSLDKASESLELIVEQIAQTKLGKDQRELKVKLAP
ncbi:MAG: hypothetical protein ACKOFA_06860 [Rhodoluna sp.]